MLATVMHCNSEAHHIRGNHGTPRPGLDRSAVIRLHSHLYLFHQVEVDKGAFLQ